MRRIILFKTGEENTPLLPATTTYYRVLDSYSLSPKNTPQDCWAVEYDDGDVADPESDPMVIGILSLYDYSDSGPNPEVRVVWRNEIWKPASGAQQDILLALAKATQPKVKGQ
jgi:hypothetical protein